MKTTPQIKICRKCLKEKCLSDYGKKSANKDRLNNFCRKCVNDNYHENKEKTKQYYLENKIKFKDYYLSNLENIKKNNKIRALGTKEERKAYLKEYRLKNKEVLSKKKAEYYIKNKDKISKYKKEYAKLNSEKIKNYQHNYCRTNKGILSHKISNHKRYMLKKYSQDGTITIESLEKLKEQQNNRCYHCGISLNFKVKLSVHLDHYMPLSKGGIHSINNVVWSCAKCNLTKNSKIPTSLLLI